MSPPPAGSVTVQWFPNPADAAGAQPVAVLAAGQTDVEPWADNEEVTIDRVVGQINLQWSVGARWVEVPAYRFAPSVAFRLGLVVQEEADATSSPFINLWSDEHLEDYEWMWLKEVIPDSWSYMPTSDENQYVALGSTNTIDLDIGVRRKLGQTDNLLLYCQYGVFNDVSMEPGSIMVLAAGSHLLRSIFMSK